MAQAARIATDSLGADHPALVDIFVNSAVVEIESGDYVAAEGFLVSARKIAEVKLGVEHPVTATILTHYSTVLRKLKRKTEADDLERQARSILRSYSATHTVDLSELGRR